MIRRLFARFFDRPHEYTEEIIQITSSGPDTLDLCVKSREGQRVWTNVAVTPRMVEVMQAYLADPQPGDFWQPEHDTPDWRPMPFTTDGYHDAAVNRIVGELWPTLGGQR